MHPGNPLTRWGLALLAGGLLAAGLRARAEDFIAPLPFHPPLAQRTNLLRTLTLLQRSTAEAPGTVRILFHGQGLAAQGWWRRVVDFLHATYPTARLQVENRAIGGDDAQRLVRTAEADLGPFQPDLLVLHASGTQAGYEDLLRNVRTRTTADILLLTDPVTRPEMQAEETRAGYLAPGNWDAWWNYSFLPSVAARFGACRVDVRDRWKRHLRDTQLAPADFLQHDTRLNSHGEYLLAEIVQAYLSPLPEEWAGRCRPFDEGRVRTLRWSAADGRVQATFEGTRLDVRPADGASWTVRVDGKSPGPPGVAIVTPASPAGVAEPGWVTVALGLSNTVHTVTLEGIGAGLVWARAYRPPMRSAVSGQTGPP